MGTEGKTEGLAKDMQLDTVANSVWAGIALSWHVLPHVY